MSQPSESDYLDPEIARTVKTILYRHPAFEDDERFVRAHLAELAHRAFQHGQSAARLDLRTTTQAADQLGMSVAWVRRVAGQEQIGWKVDRDWVFTGENVEQLRARIGSRPVGRPRKDGR